MRGRLFLGGKAEVHLARMADPVPGLGQVRVAVHAAGVNPVDTGNRADGSWAGLSLRPVVSHLLPLTAAPEAHLIVQHGHAGGKIVLDVTGG